LTEGQQGLGIPRFCGAIGAYDAGVVARVAANLGAELNEVHSDERSILFADRPPSRWTGEGTRGLAFAEREPGRTDRAKRWEDAAAVGGLGIWERGGAWTLHCSNSALAPLYWMAAGDAIYFANRIDALARAGIGTLSVDWDAWASVLTLQYVVENRTPFAEITRLGPRGSVAIQNGAPVATEPGLAWLDEEPIGAEEAAERIVATLRAEVEALEPHGPVVCPLSGGWDSRLIACALAERDLIAGTYTVGGDVGDDQEVLFAARVADALGVPHTVVDPERPSFAEEIETAAARVEYQSQPHYIMHRLERCLPAGGICTDGIGATLIKGRCLKPEILEAPDPTEATFDTLVSQRTRRLYDDGAWDALRQTALQGFQRENEPYTGFHAPPSPAIYNRSRRANGSSPTSIVGLRNRIFTPLVSDGIARPALAAPPLERGAGDVYRSVFRMINADVGSLPSTNDGLEPERVRRPGARTREARAGHLEFLARSPLRPWFAPRLEALIERGGLAPIDRSIRLVRLLASICMFGLWTERYGELVGGVDPGELLGPPVRDVGPAEAATR
jgi:hypothetical protein